MTVLYIKSAMKPALIKLLINDVVYPDVEYNYKRNTQFPGSSGMIIVIFQLKTQG